jgi:hypothetical protein
MPFRSKSQQRFMFAAEACGELPEGTARHWAHETKDIKALPEKVAVSPEWAERMALSTAKNKGIPFERLARVQERLDAQYERLFDRMMADHHNGVYGLPAKIIDANQAVRDVISRHDWSSPEGGVSPRPGFQPVMPNPVNNPKPAAPSLVPVKPPQQMAGRMSKAQLIGLGALGTAVAGLGTYQLYKWLHRRESNEGTPDKVKKPMQHPLEMRKSANLKLQGEFNFQGLSIAIENKKGSRRYWFDPHGDEKGSTYMHHDYGYIRRTKGTDGDHVDVYVGPNSESQKVFIIDQMKKPDFKEFDEQKCMLGFDSAKDAKAAYLKQYNDSRFFGSMREMSMDEFKKKVLAKENHGEKVANRLLEVADRIGGHTVLELSRMGARGQDSTSAAARRVGTAVNDHIIRAGRALGGAHNLNRVVGGTALGLAALGTAGAGAAAAKSLRNRSEAESGKAGKLAAELGKIAAVKQWTKKQERDDHISTLRAKYMHGDVTPISKGLPPAGHITTKGGVYSAYTMNPHSDGWGDHYFRVSNVQVDSDGNIDEAALRIALLNQKKQREYMTPLDRPSIAPPREKLSAWSGWLARMSTKEADKTAASAGWIREKAVSGLAKRNVVLDRNAQAQIARKAIDYARHAPGSPEARAARKELREVLGQFKKQAPNASRPRAPRPNDWAQSAPRPNWTPPNIPEESFADAMAPGLVIHGGLGALTAGLGSSGAGKLLETRANNAERRIQRGQYVNADALLLPVGGEKGMGFLGGLTGGTAGVGVGLGATRSLRGAAVGGLIGSALGYGATVPGGRKVRAQRERLNELYEKVGALSPAALSALRHGGTGAVLGAAAGGLGGAAHAQEGQRASGALRGALAGAAIGTAGGLGVHGIKAQGAKQLATLRGSATEAEQFATKAHQHAQELSHAGFSKTPPAPAAAAAKSHVDVGAATMPGKARVDVDAATMPGRAVAPNPRSELVDDYARANMTPERFGYKATANPHPGGGAGADGQLYRPMTRQAPAASTDAVSTVASRPGAVASAPAPAAAPAAASGPQLSGRLDVAQDQARAAGARSTALHNAANTLEQQQGVMHQSIDRAALTGGAAGTGLMGYMAVPRQYGGVSPDNQKVSSDDRVHRIADRVDDVGIGILASPYVNDLAGRGFKKMMLRGGRVGQVGAWGHAATEGLGHVLHHPVTEIAGLSLVAPGVVHPIAKGINKTFPQKPGPVPPSQQATPAVQAAKIAGAILANKKYAGLGRLAVGLGTVGAVGAGLYGAKKGIDAAVHAAQPHRAASYPRVRPGMPPPMSV